MRFNLGKMQMMCIPKNQGQKQTVRINNQEFSRCTQYKYLGEHLHTKNNLNINLEKRERQAKIDIIEMIAITKQMNTPERDLQITLKLFNTILYPTTVKHGLIYGNLTYKNWTKLCWTE